MGDTHVDEHNRLTLRLERLSMGKFVQRIESEISEDDADKNGLGWCVFDILSLFRFGEAGEIAYDLAGAARLVAGDDNGGETKQEKKLIDDFLYAGQALRDYREKQRGKIA